jgi:hypothetical protein
MTFYPFIHDPYVLKDLLKSISGMKLSLVLSNLVHEKGYKI